MNKMTTIKTTFRPIFLGLLLLTVGAAAFAQVEADKIRYKSIDFPDATITSALGINPSGDIVGEYRMADNSQHGFSFSKGSFTSIDYPGANWTQAWGINPQGDIVGQYKVEGDPNIHGFLLRDGDYFKIDIDPTANTMPLKISADGTIVGCFHSDTFMMGFTINDSGVSLDPMGIGITSMQTGINNRGIIVGNYMIGGAWTGNYLLVGTSRKIIGLPSGAVSRAWDLNDNGDIVGVVKIGPNFHGFLYRNPYGFPFKSRQTIILDVDLPGARDTRAFGVSSNGRIVGSYLDSSGTHGFVTYGDKR